MSIATPAFFWFPFAWNIFFYPFTFSLYVSLGLKWVSCRQHIYGSCFCIHSVSLCLLVGAFNPFTFKVIIDMYVSMYVCICMYVCSYDHFLNCFGFAIVGLFLLLCFLPREVSLALFLKLVWWCWTLLAFACLKIFWFLCRIWMRCLLGRVILIVGFSLSSL